MKPKAKQLLSPGSVVFIRTVTHYHVGRVVRIVEIGKVGFVELADAAWVADSGRFADMLKSGVVNEAEPFAGNALVGLGAIVDVAAFTGAIPLAQK